MATTLSDFTHDGLDGELAAGFALVVTAIATAAAAVRASDDGGYVEEAAAEVNNALTSVFTDMGLLPKIDARDVVYDGADDNDETCGCGCEDDDDDFVYTTSKPAFTGDDGAAVSIVVSGGTSEDDVRNALNEFLGLYRKGF